MVLGLNSMVQIGFLVKPYGLGKRDFVGLL